MNKKVSKFKIFSLLILVISSLFLVSCFETEEPISEQIKKVLDKVSIEYATNNSSDKITDNFVVPIEISGITIEWLSSNEEVLVFDNDTATITRLEYDVEVYITAQVTIDKITDFQTFKIKIIGIPLQEVGYQVMFYIDNEQYGQAQYVKEGSSAKAPTPPNKEGYDFIGWDQEFSNVEADLEINGIYSPIEYTISYTDLFNTNHPNQTTYTIEDEFVLLSPSIRHGYTFIGWYQGNEKIDKISLGTTDNIILSARFEKNTYLVKFVDYDLREIKTEFVQHGSPAIAPSNPTRVGYTFKGWNQPFNSVTSDMTIEADYSINTYKITYQVKDQNDIVQYFEYDSSIIGYKPDQIVGYSFSWDKPIPQNMPPRDLVFIGTYTPNQYKITYLVDGEEHLVREYDFGEPITITPDLIKEGYSFSWNPQTLPETMPANDLEVIGTFTINTYTVTFVDDSVIDTQTINWNEAATAPTEPTREGYTFDKWDVDFENVTSNLTVKVVYEINQYTITLVLDNGEADVKITQNYDTLITSPTEPTKEGYKFIGWDPALPSTMPAQDKTHTAQWKVNQYNVTYVVEDEENIVETYDFGTEVIIRPLLEKEGYSFSWNPQTLPATMPANDLEVIGVFTINTYTVTFVDFDDSVIDTQTINWNEAATAPTEPTREGYTFDKWDVDFSNVTKDLTVKAQFSAIKYSVTVVDGEIYDFEIYDFGTEISIRPLLEKEGYSFSWNPQTLPETMPANDLEVIGTFTINTYTVTFVDFDYRVIDTQTINWKESAIAPTEPERTGYQFTGWDADFSNVKKDLTVKAKYNVNQYTITYIVDGVQIGDAETYDFGTEISIRDLLEEEGYSFIWEPTVLPETMPANDLEVIGTFTINTYTVTFVDYDGKVIGTQTINWNESAIAPIDPERTGYQFTGWDVDFSNVKKDLTVKAQYNVNQYTITYSVDGVQIGDTETYNFGAEISIRTLLEKEGYSFSWDPKVLPETMPANDLEVIGLFTINTYTVIFVDFDDRFINTQTIIWNESATAPTEPERTGYQFTGWDVDFSNVKKDLTVKAKYSINQYTITLVLDNGEVNIEITQDYDTEVLPTKPTKEGHKFIGWNPILPSTMPAQDKTHTAQWEVNQYNVTYIVEDEENIVDTYYFDEEIIMPIEPTKDGYSFIGWFTNENLTEEFILSKMPANNIILFAKWTALPVITLNLYDDKKILIYQEPGTELTVEEPTRTGYEFTGWNPALPSTMPSEDGMYTAQWKVKQYTVTYVVDGLDNIVKEYDFGEPITIIQDLVKEGYSFSWNPKVLPATMPAENLVVLGTYAINTYTVTFVDYDDNVLDTQTIKWNEPATAPTEPERTGYQFTGWDVDFSNVKKDLTVKAKYSINQYTITLVLDNGEDDVKITQNYDTLITSPTEPTKEGYEFIGWDPALPSTMPAENKTHTAQWEVKQYTVEYVVDGQTYVFDTYDFGKEIIKPINPTKEGHTFTEWDNELPVTMPAENIVLTAVWEIDKFDVTFDVGESQTINYKHHINYDEVPNALDVNSQWFGFEFYGWSIDGSENIISRDYEVTENIHLTARFIKHITQADIVNNNRFDIDDTSIDQIIYKSKISNQEMPTNGIDAYLSFNALTGIVLIDDKLPSGSLSSNYLTINDKSIASSSNDNWRTAKFINNYNEELHLGFYKQGSQNEGSETLISNIRIIVGEVYNTQFNVYEHKDYGYGQLEVPPQPYLIGQIVEITTTPEGEAAFVGFQVNQSWVYGNGDEVIHETIHGLEVTQNKIEFIAYFKQYITLSEMSATINPGEIKENTISVLTNTTLQIVEDVDNLTILFNIIDKDPLVKLVIKNNGLEILSTFDETFELEFDAIKRFNQIEVVFEKDNFIKRAITFEVLVFSSTRGLTNDRNINILNDLYYPYEKNKDTNEYISTNGRIKENNISLLKIEVDVKNPLGGIFQFDFKLHTLKSENQHLLIVYIGEDRPVDATNSETRDSDLYTGVTSWQTYELALDYGKHTIYIGYYRVWDEGLTRFLDNLEIKNIWLDDGTEELLLDFNTQGGDVLVNGNTYDYNNNRYDREAELELTPSPTANYSFVYWIDFDGNVIYDWQITVLLDESKYYQAVFVNTEIYKFRIGTDVYTSLEEAVSNSIYGDVLILLGKEYTLDYNITIPEGVSLLIPLNEKDYQGFNIEIELTTDTTEYYNPHGVVLGKEKLYATFTINEGVTLTVNGFVYVNAITGRNQGGTQVQNISGDYSQIELNGKIIVSQTGTLESAGKIYGSGEIEVLQGGSFGETFVVRGWRGGSQAESQFGSINMDGAFPFNEYEMPYVTTTIKVHSGASYYGLVKMYALSRFYATRFNQFNDTKGLIQLSEGAFAIIEKQVNKNVLVEAKQYTDVLVRATITINGGATEIGGSLKVAGLSASTASMESFYPINGNITLNLENGDYVLNHNLKFLTGSILNIKENATLLINKIPKVKPLDKEINSMVAFYDEYIDRVTGETSYPDRPAAELNLFGKLIIKGAMSGTITAYNGSTVETSADAVFELSPGEANGWMNSFYYFHTVLRISPVNGDIIEEITAGEVYNF